MAENAVFALAVRVFYKKQGRIKYISHLDLNRCVARCLKRSGLPVWHTMGFNPHIYVTFALPLALGYESVCESMDFRLTELLPMETVVERLNAVFPEGLEAFRCQPLGAKPEAICWADYEITQEFDGKNSGEVLERFNAWCARPELPVIKKTKKGERTIDVKPHFSVKDLRAEGNMLFMTMRAAAGGSLNINPTLILDRYAEESGDKADWIRVMRTAILDENGKDFA